MRLEDRRSHVASTLHMFNRQLKPKRRYGIPESNVGYRMLKDHLGWDEERGGLGPEGKGPVYPLATSLRRERAGLGVVGVATPLRVTHMVDEVEELARPQRRGSPRSKEMKARTQHLLQAAERASKLREEERRRQQALNAFSPIDYQLLLGTPESRATD